MTKPTIIVGSKDTALTPAAVYNVTVGFANVEPDSSSLDLFAGKLHGKVAAISILPKERFPSYEPVVDELRGGERDCAFHLRHGRAVLVVLLHKLLLGPPAGRRFLPIFIAEALNVGVHLVSPSANKTEMFQAFVASVYEQEHSGDTLSENLKNVLEASGAGQIGVTEAELVALRNAFEPAVGIAALASYTVSELTVVAGAVAALSCEALRGNTEPFASESYKQEFARKSEADVAGDLNSLLFGSKLVKVRKGGVDADCIRNIPASHGALRDAAQHLAPRLRVEINRVSSTLSAGDVQSYLFTNSLLPLLGSLLPNISGCLERTSTSLKFVRDLNPEKDGLSVDWEDNLGSRIEVLKQSMQAAAASAVVSGDHNSIVLAREAGFAVETWRMAICNEWTSALALLSIREGISGGKAPELDGVRRRSKEEEGESNLAGANGKPRSTASSKVKSDFVLGKGTSIVRRCVEDYVHEDSRKKNSLGFLFSKLSYLLVFENPEFQALVTKVKGVLESNEVGRLPKVAKGTRDFKPKAMAIREKAFGIIAAVFKRHGAVTIDTPVFELKETLMGKYGEDSKLIYDLADQGGEMLSLRYDLTVPFARYVAMTKEETLKRYHIAKVYRRDKPTKGRYREFYQCDFDIAGQYPLMVPDFEVLKVLTELLDELEIGDYEVKLNHRKLLDGMLDICGVPQSKFRSICSAIDKLDKLPWEKVHQEMVEEKGLTTEVADKIGKLVQSQGSPLVLLEELQKANSPFLQHTASSAALEELGVLFKYLKASKCIDRIVFDLSLARGLDYYTGVIYEAVMKGSNQVGSIAAGGRYDNLVGMFSSNQVPAVGVSLGIERVFTIMEKDVVRANETDVWVVIVGKSEKWTEVAVEMVAELWGAKLKAEFFCVAPAKIYQQFGKAKKLEIPWVVLAGEDELNKGVVKLKDISAEEEETISRDNLVKELRKRLGIAA